MELEPKLYPPWRQAVEQFVAAGFKYGDLVPHEWVYAALGVEKPSDATPYGDARKVELYVMDQFTEFRREVLERLRMDLSNDRGVGYRIVPPAEQTKEAFDDGMRDIKKGMRKMLSRLTYVDHSSLTAEQARENNDAISRAAQMNAMIKQARRLPPPMPHKQIG